MIPTSFNRLGTRGGLAHTELLYLETSGVITDKQHIDTEQAVDTFDEVWEIHYEVLTEQKGITLIGSQTGANTNVIPMTPYRIGSATQFYLGTGSYKHSLLLPINTLVKVITVTQPNKTYELFTKVGDESIQQYTGSFIGNLSNLNVYLLGSNQNNAPLYTGGHYRLYKVVRTRASVKIMELVPVRLVTGTVCMYDKINDKYHYNRGSGVFTAGPAV